MSKITKIDALEILDSRANPTVEVILELDNKFIGNSKVPSGASCGKYEAVELRDNDSNRYNGKGVLKAINNINKTIKENIINKDFANQEELDNYLIKLDNTNNKSNLGANAILGVSCAFAKAKAMSEDKNLYEYFGNGLTLPVPMMNVLNGGKHADNNVSSQEFMIMPVGANTFSEALRWCSEVYHTLKKILKENNLTTSVGDEGGFAPNLKSDEEALDLLVEAIKKAGYKPGVDFFLACDIASTEMWEEAKKINKEGNYYFWKTDEVKTKDEMIDWIISLCEKYPLLSVEDSLAEDDFEGWKKLTEKLSNKIQLVGDDLFVTNTNRLQMGINKNLANSILIKLNQIGTITETINACNLARKNNYTSVISHRSGETEDTTIADLVVGLNTGQIKTGAPCRSDRVAKYNRLLEIEYFNKNTKYYGKDILKEIKK